MLLHMRHNDALPNPYLEILSNFVRDARARSGFSLHEIQRRGGPAPSLVSDLETGKKLEIPKPATLAKLAKGLGVPVDDVMRAAGLLPFPGDLSTPISGQIADQAVAETPKPWPLHDSSHSGTANEATERTLESGNELSKTDQPDKPSGSIDMVKGDNGHILSLADMGPWKRLPVFRVSCGERILLNDEPLEVVSLPSVITGSSDGILKVEGTSMLGCGYRPGDLLFFERINGRRPKDGDKVIAEVNGGAVCKLYRRDEGGEFLVSAPGDQDDMHFFHRITDEVRLIGIVKKRITDA